MNNIRNDGTTVISYSITAIALKVMGIILFIGSALALTSFSPVGFIISGFCLTSGLLSFGLAKVIKMMESMLKEFKEINEREFLKSLPKSKSLHTEEL
ncbi:MAG: hypothetical protein ACYC00_14590 [Eubacteriales bacterium]